jgi:hypothetical protein
MDKQSRRQVVRDYKERKVAQGIFAVRCAATAQVWTGASRNLDQQQNSIWFSLRQGGHPNSALGGAWAAHGEATFVFEVVETLAEEDLSPYARDNRLKDREAHWRATLGATKVAG